MSDVMVGANFDPQRGGHVSFGDDSKLFVQFHKKPMQDTIKSRDAQRPIFVPVDFVRIQQPGDRLSVIDRPASEEDKARFPRQWMVYQQGQQDAPAGTLLAILFPNNPEVVETLKYLKIFTVETLAGLNDTQIQNLGMGGLTFVQKAKEFLAGSEKGKGFDQLEARIAAHELKIQELNNRNAALEGALAERDEEAPRRGRPPKQAAG